MKKYLLIILLLVGCQTTQYKPVPVQTVETISVNHYTNVVIRAVIAGLENVNPIYYNGWNGRCPGADLDVNRFERFCISRGVTDITVLRNSEATKAGFFSAIWSAGGDLEADDLLIIYYSGHGGLIKDFDGNEASGMDSTLCMWDGQWLDDDFGVMVDNLKCRILFPTDCCNSGSNFRSPPSFTNATLPSTFTGQLIHYGGCNDGEYSYGEGRNGGSMSYALMVPDPGNQNNISWFALLKQRMANDPNRQVPTYAEYGNVTGTFRLNPILK